MRVLFDGEVHVSYRQFYVESGTEWADLDDCFTGQANGLCGAASAGSLYLITGLHTGRVGFTAELHDKEPPWDHSWEEAVEVSFTPASAEVQLVHRAGEASWLLDLDQVDYRVRYYATGMDAARAADTVLAGEPLLDHYLLQFWPAPHAPDRIHKQTSEIAAYWHPSRP